MRRLAIIGLALVVIGVILILIFGIGAGPAEVALTVPPGNSCLVVSRSSSSLPSLPGCDLPVGSVALVSLVVGVIVLLAAYLRRNSNDERMR